MNDKTDQKLKEMAAAMSEILDNVRSIKGEDFAEMVRLLHLATHTARTFRGCLSPRLQERHIDLLFTQYEVLIDCALQIIVKHRETPDEEFKEMAKWAEVLDDRVVATLTNLDGDKP